MLVRHHIKIVLVMLRRRFERYLDELEGLVIRWLASMHGVLAFGGNFRTWMAFHSVLASVVEGICLCLCVGM